MISRRQFTKTLGGAVTLTAIKPDALWSGEPIATATPTSVSPVAAELYRRVFVLDSNVLAEIGQAIRVAVETTTPERRPVIVGKLHHAHAETAEQLDPVDLVLEHVR